MRPRWVKKRDGRRAPFDLRKLRDSLVAAADAVQESVLSEELAEAVTYFLERRFANQTPTSNAIRDLCERVLLETNHARVAAAYAEHRAARERGRQAVLVASGLEPPLDETGELSTEPALEAWSEGDVSRTLHARYGLDLQRSEAVAAAVERRVLGLELPRVSTTLIRELVQAELNARGIVIDVSRRDVVTVPAHAVKGLLSAAYVRRHRNPDVRRAGSEALVGVDLLSRYALRSIHTGAVAHAHREGRIHLRDIGRPLRVHSGAIGLDALKRSLGTNAPGSAAEAALAVARAVRRAEASHTHAIGIPWFNVLLAPFARGKRDPSLLRDLREAFRILIACAPEARLRLHLAPVPPALAPLAPVGRAGRRWRTTYGERASEADRVTQHLLAIGREELPLAAGGSLELVQTLAANGEGPELEATAAILVDLGLVPPLSEGFAPAEALAEVLPAGECPMVAGAARVVGVSAARAALEVTPGDLPAFREHLLAGLDLALEAFEQSFTLLDLALYRPRLPLWEAEAEPQRVLCAPRERAVCVVGLIGLLEGIARVLGEPASQNPAVLTQLGQLTSEFAEAARTRGAQRGLTVRLEEPPLELAAQRLTEIDLVLHGAQARRLLRHAKGEAYGTRLAPLPATAEQARAALDAVYRPLGLSPVLKGPEQASQVAAYLGAFDPAPA